ncbi:hypothetical protein [Halomonas sp. BC04]|uniref:hypothetical protein n=1 Tax=Halomonas sp. BC04 TaxID=1403540 RepID=UPI0003ED6BBA|nr:hypothetical protein Q427_02995 [Halomonas sp. BC04]
MSDRSPSHPEQSASWRRWQMGELQDESRRSEAERAAKPAEDPARQERFRRQAELKALREKTLREARDEGFKAGFEEGRAQGQAQAWKKAATKPRRS